MLCYVVREDFRRTVWSCPVTTVLLRALLLLLLLLLLDVVVAVTVVAEERWRDLALPATATAAVDLVVEAAEIEADAGAVF